MKCVVCMERPRALVSIGMKCICEACYENWRTSGAANAFEWTACRARAFERKRNPPAVAKVARDLIEWVRVGALTGSDREMFISRFKKALRQKEAKRG